MIRFILRFVLILFSNTALLYLISFYFSKNLGFSLEMTEGFSLFVWDTHNIVGILIMGFVFWFFNTIISSVIKLFTLPIKFLTLGISNIFVNIGVFYLIKYFVNNHIEIGFNMTLGTIGQTFILSLILAVSSAIIHFIIKKII